MSITTQRLGGRGAQRSAARTAVAAPAAAWTGAAAVSAPPPALARATQVLVVTTAPWDTTGGTLRRCSGDATGAWRAEGAPVPVVVGRTGLAWGVGVAPDGAGEPAKREGDG